MNWKYLLGKTLANSEAILTGSNSAFIYKHYPFGRNWIFDLKRILKVPPQTIIDAGANIGSISTALNSTFPKATVFAFEPVEDTFRILCANTAAIKNIYPVNLALGAKSEEITIMLNRETTLNSLKTPVLAEGESIGKEKISVARLDDLLLEKGISQIDILKIDVEGFENEVLQGCGKLLNNTKCILLEVGYTRHSSKVHFSETDLYLEQQGFELWGIYDLMHNLDDKRRIAHSNNLYINNHLI